MLFGKRGVVIILQEEQDTLVVVKKAKVGLAKKTYDFGSFSYPLDWTHASYIEKNKPVLIFKIGNSIPLTLKDPPEVKSPRFLNMLAKEKIVEQLVKAASPFIFNNMMLIMVILGIMAGIGIGYMMYPHIHPPPTIVISNATKV